MLNKQAQVLNQDQIDLLLKYVSSTKQSSRNKVMVMLSIFAGLRAKEIAGIKWKDVMNDNKIGEAIYITNETAKGSKGGRVIPLHEGLREALQKLYKDSEYSGSDNIIGLSTQVITNWFYNTYKGLSFEGCSSHSGRRTFITNTARLINNAGGSIKDIQALAGHSNVNTTLLYIDESIEAKRNVVNLL